MRESRFTEEQIVAILQEQAAGGKTREPIRRHGISRETFCKWTKKVLGEESATKIRNRSSGPKPQRDQRQDRTWSADFGTGTLASAALRSTTLSGPCTAVTRSS